MMKSGCRRLMFLVMLAMSCPTLFAEPLQINTVEYNYNAACLFIDFMQAKSHFGNSLYLDNKQIDTKYLKYVDKTQHGVQRFTYGRNGVEALLVKSQDGFQLVRLTFEATLLPEHMRSRQYLLSILDVKQTKDARTAMLGCDAVNLVLRFNGDTLQAIETEPDSGVD